jgi:hypothetical protein
VAAILLGALIAPLALLLADWPYPFLSAVILYGLLAFVFGLVSPARSWRWGVWVTLGILMMLVVLPAANLADASMGLRPNVTFSPRFVWLTFALTYLPGVVGGSAGGFAGSRLGWRWKLRKGAAE